MKHIPEYLIWRKQYQKLYRKELSRLPLYNIREILEIGCGGGFFTEILRNQFKNSTLICIDIDSSVERDVRNFCNQFIVTDCCHLPIAHKYDLVVAHDMMHHLSSEMRRATIREIRRVTKDNGYILIVETISNFHTKRQKRMLECKELEALINIKNAVIPEKILDIDKLIRLLEKNNLNIVYKAVTEYSEKFPDKYVDRWLDTLHKDIKRLDDEKMLKKYEMLRHRVKEGVSDLPSAIILCKR